MGYNATEDFMMVIETLVDLDGTDNQIMQMAIKLIGCYSSEDWDTQHEALDQCLAKGITAAVDAFHMCGYIESESIAEDGLSVFSVTCPRCYARVRLDKRGHVQEHSRRHTAHQPHLCRASGQHIWLDL